MDGDGARVPRPGVSGRSPLADLDELDRRIILGLEHDGRASWTTIAETIGSSPATVTRRGQQLIDGNVVRVTVMPQTGSSGRSEMFFLRITCKPGGSLAVAEQLAANPDVRFVSMVTGGYDVMAELVVRGGAETYAAAVHDLQALPGIERWRSDLVLHIHKVGHAWGEQLYHESIGHHEPLPVSEPHECDPSHFDEMDRRLVDALQSDGRETFTALGRLLGIDATNARRRFERLRADGCVDVVTLVPAAALGFGSETVLMIQAEPGHLEEVATTLAGYSAVRYMAALLDGNCLMCEVIAPSTEQLYQFLSRTLAQLGGVRSWTAATELLSLKRGFVETPWWRRQLEAPGPAAVRSGP